MQKIGTLERLVAKIRRQEFATHYSKGNKSSNKNIAFAY